MARDGQVLRQWRLWRLLAASHAPLSTEELAAALGDGVSARTVRRDLQVLRDVGAAVRELREGKTLRYAALDDGPGLRLDPDTLLALRLALGLMRPFEGTPVGECLDQLVRRLERTIPARALEHFRPLTADLSVRVTGAPSYSAPAAAVLQSIRDAIGKGRCLEIVYAPLQGRSGMRLVHPQAVVYGPRGLYLLASDETRRGALRTFRLERISTATPSSAPARRDPGFDPDDLLAGSIGIASPEHPPRTYTIRIFSEAVARLLEENPWHESQRVKRHPDGRWTVTVEITSSRELLSRVLALGPVAEVVGPETFRSQVRKALHQAAKRYDAGHDLSGVDDKVTRSEARPPRQTRRTLVE